MRYVLVMLGSLVGLVIVAFTAEEETGRCLGAKSAYQFMERNSKYPTLYVSLDVTDEGYDDNKLCSIEGLHANNDIESKIADSMMITEGEEQSFCVIKANHKDSSPFNKDYIDGDYTVFDEGVYYGQTLNQNALSFCLPTDGSMHSNTGLDVKDSIFTGYILSLDTFIHQYTNTKNYEIEDIKDYKDYLVNKAKETKKVYAFANLNYRPDFNYTLDDYYEEDEDLYEDSFSIAELYGIDLDEKGKISSDDIPYELESTLSELAEGYGATEIYEYLAENKPVIAVDSLETRRFGTLVYRYHNYKELKQLCNMELKKPFETETECMNYIEKNSWEERTKQFEKILEEL